MSWHGKGWAEGGRDGWCEDNGRDGWWEGVKEGKGKYGRRKDRERDGGSKD